VSRFEVLVSCDMSLLLLKVPCQTWMAACGIESTPRRTAVRMAGTFVLHGMYIRR
jgi:hypothetical protein